MLLIMLTNGTLCKANSLQALYFL